MMSGSSLISVIMTKIKYSVAALQDLEEIGDYITNTLKSPKAALNTLDKIQDTIDKLADFPIIGSLLSSVIKTETDYRLLICGNYLVFYHVFSDSVFISRILYGKRDYLAILFNVRTEIEPE